MYNVKGRRIGRRKEGGRVCQPSKEGNFRVFLGHQFQDAIKINQELTSNTTIYLKL